MNDYQRQIVLDTETTGLEHRQGHRIIEIGCVELINRKLTGNNYHVYLNPERCLLYTSPSPRDLSTSRMPSSA